MSHQKKGWEDFTLKVIQNLNDQKENLVFMAWGSPAIEKIASVNRNKHLVLTNVHPSPLSAYRGFLGCKHFSKCNDYLLKNGKKPINWSLN
jgi:uracil-DNA glycosylase